MTCLITTTLPCRTRMQHFVSTLSKGRQCLLYRPSAICTHQCKVTQHEKQYRYHKSFATVHRNVFLSHQCNRRTTLRAYTSSTQESSSKCLVGEKDRFNAIMVDLCREGNQQFLEGDGFGQALAASTSSWQQDDAIAIWLRVPLAHSRLIPIAAGQGFGLHHTEGDNIYLCKWLLDCPSRLPAYANHQIGVSGFVFNEEKEEVLMIQDKHRIVRWKFPGGLSNFGEDIPDTAIREVWEETGIKTEFQSILCFRQQHKMPWVFGISDIYVICRLRPLNFDLNICKDELVDAKWTKVEEILKDPSHTLLTVRVAKLIQHGLKYGFDSVDITIDELPSVYKNTTYKLFHKPLPT